MILSSDIGKKFAFGLSVSVIRSMYFENKIDDEQYLNCVMKFRQSMLLEGFSVSDVDRLFELVDVK